MPAALLCLPCILALCRAHRLAETRGVHLACLPFPSVHAACSTCCAEAKPDASAPAHSSDTGLSETAAAHYAALLLADCVGTDKWRCKARFGGLGV